MTFVAHCTAKQTRKESSVLEGMFYFSCVRVPLPKVYVYLMAKRCRGSGFEMRVKLANAGYCPLFRWQFTVALLIGRAPKIV